MRVSDYRKLGLLPLRDHRDIAVEDRITIRAGLVESRDEFGRFTISGHGESENPNPTYGDVQAPFHIPAASSGRPMGSWFLASYGISESDYVAADPDAPLASVTRGGASRNPYAGFEIPDAPPGTNQGDSGGFVSFRPVGNQKWASDTRYQSQGAAVHPEVDSFPKGTPLLVLASTREAEQQLLAMPLSSNKLICPNHAGDPKLGTYVYDLTADDEPDDERKAQLQTFWRVVKLAGGCGLGGGGLGQETHDALAWQLSQSGNLNAPVDGSGLDGRGLVVDWAGAETVGAPDPPTPQEPPAAGATPIDLSGNGVIIITDLSTRTRPPTEGSGAREGDKPPPGMVPPDLLGDDPLVVAAVTARRSGFIEVGDVMDVHRLGKTFDNQPVNCAHLAVDALWKNDVGDGPLDFENLPYEPPTLGAPFLTPVHLRWDESVTHNWVCGQSPGKWRWEAETFFTIPEAWGPWMELDEEEDEDEDEEEEEERKPKRPKGPPGGIWAPHWPPGIDVYLGPARECQTTPGYVTPGQGAGGSGQGGVTAGGGFVGPPLPLGGISRVGGSDPGPSPGTAGQTPTAHNPSTPEPRRAKQKEPLVELARPRQGAPGIPGHGVSAEGIDGNQAIHGTFNLFGGGSIPSPVRRALKSRGVIDAYGRPSAVPPPQVGDGRMVRKARHGGLLARHPLMVQTATWGGGVRFGTYATATGQTNLTGGGWIRKEMPKLARGGPAGGLTAFGNTNGTGAWDDLQTAEGAESLEGGVVFGPPELTQPETLRKLLDGDYHPDAADDMPGFKVPLYLPGGAASLFFGHPTDGTNDTVGGGSTSLEQTTDGLVVQPYDAAGVSADPKRVVFTDDEVFVEGTLDLVVTEGDLFVGGRAQVVGRCDASLFCGDQTLVSDTTVLGSKSAAAFGGLAVALGATLTIDLGGRLTLL